jgi:hypothetical protein
VGANNSDLLRLGPAALESIAKANLKQETHTLSAISTDYANRTGTNKIGDAIADATKGQTADEKKMHTGALMNFMQASPADREAALAKLQEVHEKLEEAHPEKFKNLGKRLEEKKAETNTAEKTAKKENATTGAKDAKANIKEVKANAEETKKGTTKSRLLATLD